MSLLSYFFGTKQKTASMAKERLSLIIAHERGTNRTPDFLPDLQRELIAELALLGDKKDVALEDISMDDSVERIVGKVMVAAPDCQRPDCAKALDAGLGQVTAGLAWWYRKYAMEQSAEDARSYETAEQEARASHVGLWRDAEPIPPWDWRKKDRQ